MRRQNLEADNAVGHDSFLDVVANIVGILIVLVIVAGLRARNAPVKAAPLAEEVQPLAAALEKDDATQRQLYAEVMQVARQMDSVQREAAVRQIERNRLATLVAALEHELATRRDAVGSDARAEFDLKRSLAEARHQLERIEHQSAQAAGLPPETEVVESYPTPLGKPVDEDEVHFQLRGGRIVFIPLDELVSQFRLDARRQLYRLLDMPELTETIGPVDGFRMRYTLERHSASVGTRTGPETATYARLKRWTILPQSNQMGERVDDALADGSAFRKVLARLQPGKSTITVWTYPDSFEVFRRIKKELYQLGFAAAGRPLPDDVPISGSPDGTKSTAE